MAKVYLAFVGGGHAGLINDIANPQATPGKETPYIRSLGRRIQEEEFNEPVAAYTRDELKRHGVHVYDPAPGPLDVSLRSRTDYANRIYKQYCDKYGKENVVAVYLSIHYNAMLTTFGGSNASGFSVHVYKGHRNKEAGRLANYLIEEFKKQAPWQVNRGVVEQNLHITRETNMVAALTENGFMDDEEDAEKMLDKNFQKGRANANAKAILRYMGISYKAPTKPTTTSKPKPVTTSSGDYTIKKGDTFWGIEEALKLKHGTLQKLNPKVDAGSLQPGQKIKTKEQPAQFRIKVIASSLYYYNRPDWNAKAGTVKKDEVFTVIDTLIVGGSKMYKLKSGTYMTANEKYVKKV